MLDSFQRETKINTCLGITYSLVDEITVHKNDYNTTMCNTPSKGEDEFCQSIRESFVEQAFLFRP